MNVFSAFTPTAGVMGWTGAFSRSDENATEPDFYNNWWPGIPPSIMNITKWPNPNYLDYMDDTSSNVSYTPQQIYIQTSDQSIVCTMGNASFDVEFTFIEGIQVQSEYVITDFQTFWAPESAVQAGLYQTTDGKDLEPDHFRETHSYLGIFVAFTSLLNGNVTTTLSNIATLPKTLDVLEFDGNALIAPGPSESLKNGLSACPEYAHGKVRLNYCQVLITYSCHESKT
jgi:hypothetical protein